MKNAISIVLSVFMAIVLFSCAEHNANQEVQIPPISVKVSRIEQGNISKTVELNGKTIYLKKDKVVSPISGYVFKTRVKYGDAIQKGDILFELQTKESNALGNNVGDVQVLASSAGTVSELNINQQGTYVVEGDLLCSIVENNDLMVQVFVPFNYNSMMKIGGTCEIILPNQKSISGTVARILPAVNEADQTLLVLIKPSNNEQLPENLNLTVQIVSEKHSNVLLVDKASVMTNEKQDKFWVMKMCNDSLAICIPVMKGIGNDSLVEVLSNALHTNDLIINQGAYGLPDSCIVKIVE